MMGLDISHNAWHGSYGSFMSWRKEIARLAGLPPLELMDGYYNEDSGNPLILLNFKYPKGDELDMSQLRRIFKRLPIKWECLNPNPLHELLYHSDCDGHINYGSCKKIADELEKLLPLMEHEEMPYSLHSLTKQFIEGCRLAHSKKQKLIFH